VRAPWGIDVTSAARRLKRLPAGQADRAGGSHPAARAQSGRVLQHCSGMTPRTRSTDAHTSCSNHTVGRCGRWVTTPSPRWPGGSPPARPSTPPQAGTVLLRDSHSGKTASLQAITLATSPSHSRRYPGTAVGYEGRGSDGLPAGWQAAKELVLFLVLILREAASQGTRRGFPGTTAWSRAGQTRALTVSAG